MSIATAKITAPGRPACDRLSHLDFDNVRRAAEQCRETGRAEMALKLFALASAIRPQDTELKAQIALLRADMGFAPDAEGGDGLRYTGNILQQLMDLFDGRDDVHAVQFHSSAGTAGYRPVRRAWTANDWIAHLDGDLTLGVYPVRPDGTVRFGALDLDVRKDFLAQRRLDSEFAARVDRHMRGLVSTLIARLADRGASALPEFSGSKGYHLWIFFKTAVPARAVRALLREVAGPASEKSIVSIEVFPKQDAVPPGGIGNLIKVPLGVHRVSGKRSAMLDPQTLEPIEPAAALSAVSWTPPVVLPAVPALPVCQPAEPGPPRAEAPHSSPPPARGAPGMPGFSGCFPRANTTAEGVRAMLRACPVLGSLVRKARDEHHLTHGERVVLLYTLGHLGVAGHRALHIIISNCSDYSPDRTEHFYRTLKPNAIGCAGIRRWMPETMGQRCACCVFALPPGWYPSPVLHAGAITAAPTAVTGED